ncbi:MAG: BtrH N-terminal domain-containing protein [Chrysiogenetes bacterium]|nr:BtrH N-terminal domain-containing protein [Chrysiogenetes bacterium]
MSFVLPNYQHARGRHCGSGSLANLCRYAGHPLSEPMVIGLGASLGFIYMENSAMSPGRVFFPRNNTLEQDFCRHAGVKLEVHREKDQHAAWEGARNALEAGLPVMLNSDIYELHYFGSRTHFNGHKTLLVGHDEKGAIISDTEFDEIQHEPLDTLAKARSSKYPPSLAGDSPWYTFAFEKSLRPLERAIPEAIADQATKMLSAKGNFGCGGMDMAGERLGKWGEAEDWQWAARFAYQIIERRGTGGGGFRKMYAEFLAESRELVPAIADARLDELMAKIAADWTALGEECKRLSEREEPGDFSEAAERMRELAGEERAFFESAAKHFAS